MANGTESSNPNPSATMDVPRRKTPYERVKHDLEKDPRVAQELALGKRVGFYKLKGQLGSGNFSRVKLGHHLLTNEKVAIKIIDKTKLDEHSRRLLSREITCMERLDHPNVIRLYEVIETFPRLHIVMECASEGDLHAKIVKDGPFDEGSGRKIYTQVVSAINHMHKKGVIHRDLKAENVFFVSTTQIKVGDFGFSIQSSGELLDTFCGSPPYAAPELFSEESYSGSMVDVWALGILLYFMLTGNMPFRAETVPQLKEKILEGKYNMPSSLTPACQDLIAGLLRKDTGERYTIEGLMNSVWLRGENDSESGNIPSLSSDGQVRSSSSKRSTLAASFSTESTVHSEVTQMLEQLGVPSAEMDQVIGEPRNPIAGTYRILLHRKHTASLNSMLTHQKSVSNDRGKHGHSSSSAVANGERSGNQSNSEKCPQNTKPGQQQKSKFCVIL